MPRIITAEPGSDTTMDAGTQKTNHRDGTGSGRRETGWKALLSADHAATTVMLCLGVALYAFNSFLVTTALPSAVGELGGERLIAWALSLYLAASIVAGSVAALLKQAIGARLALALAALLFLAGTLICAEATSMQDVLAGRILQGIGEGIVAAICYALIPEMYPSALMPKVFGAEAAVWAVGAFGAPAFAGWLTETVSWRAAFLVNVPMILLFLALALAIAPGRSISAEPLRFPGARLGLLAAAFIAVLWAGVRPPAEAVALVAATLVLLLAAVALDRRAGSSMLPETAFRLSSPLGLLLWVVLLMPIAQSANGVYLVFALQEIWGFGPTAAGGLAALMAISWSTVAILVANLADPARQRMMIWIGPAMLIAGMGFSLTAIASGLLSPVFAAQVLIGCGFGVSWAFLSKLSMDLTAAHERDKTSALLPTLQSAGYALGGGLVGLAANSAGLRSGADPALLRDALLVAYGTATLLAIPALFAAIRALQLSAPGKKSG